MYTPPNRRPPQRACSSISPIGITSALCALVAACGSGGGYEAPPAPGASLARGPSNSGPIQISADDKTVWVANPEATRSSCSVK
jgi:hypothetical protein